MEVELLPFTFTSNFESGNLARVERVDPPGSYVGSSSTTSTSSSNSRKKASCVAQQSAQQSPGPPELPVNYEFNLWTRPDCGGTQYENNNRTWFFFGIKGGCTGSRVRLSVMNLNKQSKLYSQGMQPVMKQVPCNGNPSKIKWDRIKEKCSYRSAEGSTVCSWVHTVVDGSGTTFYAFTYPFTYLESQTMLEALDHKFPANCPTLYYHRELLIYSLDGWRTDLITVSSNTGKTEEREERQPGLFPNQDELRPHRFPGKKVVFVSARVHPGETPSSFVFNGFLDFIVSNNTRAVMLRDMFVFKLIPMLNPDGVVRGHYRSDQRGVNLNRVYSDPSSVLHPTIYAARQIILYHHHGQLTTENQDTDTSITALSSSDSKSQVNTSTTSTGSGSTPPVVMDEDTCHSFSEATGTVSSSGENPSSHVGGNVRGRRNSFFELDEPSASGWDISSSLQGTFQRDHDDCSNASCMSETETGVTSMFGSMASVKDFRNLLSANKVSTQTGIQSNMKTENHNVKSRDLFLKDLQKEHVDKMQMSSQVTEDSDKMDLSNKLHPWEVISTSSKTTPNLAASTLTSPINKNIFPTHTSTSNSSQQDLLPDIGATSNVTLQSSGDTSMTSYKFLSAPSLETTSSNTLSPKVTPTSQMNFLGAGAPRDLCGGMASSSESEAETGRPGREALEMAAINSRSSIIAGTNTILKKSKLDTPQTSDGGSQTQHNFSTSNLAPPTPVPEETEVNSGLYLYVDLHGHASKRGIFIYGNWYEDAGIMVENMLFPKLMSINHPNFDFAACNFSERNMYLKDRRDGMSKEGSGRVAIMRATGLLRSYTLECNYNTGRTYNNCPPSPMDSSRAKAREANCTSPPKYTPTIFEECGRQLGVSLLDETSDVASGVSENCDQWSRLPHSQYHNVAGVRSWLHHFLASSALSPRTHNTGTDNIIEDSQTSFWC